jgi:hypothetical protein
MPLCMTCECRSGHHLHGGTRQPGGRAPHHADGDGAEHVADLGHARERNTVQILALCAGIEEADQRGRHAPSRTRGRARWPPRRRPPRPECSCARRAQPRSTTAKRFRSHWTVAGPVLPSGDRFEMPEVVRPWSAGEEAPAARNHVRHGYHGHTSPARSRTAGDRGRRLERPARTAKR